MVPRISFTIFLVLLVIYVMPIVIYGLSSILIGAKMPDGVSPVSFLVSVFISKLGTAIAFVLIFYIARNSLGGHWLLYAFIWWIMFVLGEASQTIGSNYTWREAISGIISESIYLPISALLVNWLIKS